MEQLEIYLSKLERALGPIPVIAKADIITEVKNQILEAQERDKSQPLDGILRSFGEPRTVANKYLNERGLRPTVEPKTSSVAKWLALGIVGIFGISVLFLGILIWKFSPIVHIDEEKGRIVLLGGLVDINEELGSIKIGSTFMKQDLEAQTFEGSKTISDAKTKTVEILFANGKIDLFNSSNSEFSWDCQTAGFDLNPQIIDVNGGLKLDLTRIGGVRCDIEVPKAMMVRVDGANAKLRVSEPKFNMDARIGNGKVWIRPDKDIAYRYNLNVTNGKIDQFASSAAEDAFEMKVDVVNGVIRKN